MAIGVESALELFEKFLSFLLAYNTTFLEDSLERNLCCNGLSDGHHYEEVSLGHLRRFGFRELQVVTNNFTSKNQLGKRRLWKCIQRNTWRQYGGCGEKS
ncbi:hypothetical protein IGI04_004699 [Brassica rapa subsp. trilocularis]|uniref:FBD domain-containing protein n=1 Tax=Brassica rapa subsp. trilocularis TaxID=1813537 RepID=A0ABQ7NBV2_BRACM|nr:hypothetical protein IGI04_015834 [Brassica rapa subsp. trilocularis]KAG5408380.1 hypothetical protein IGI04_004699 [Brassica rapa subsp. trilocularis]